MSDEGAAAEGSGTANDDKELPAAARAWLDAGAPVDSLDSYPELTDGQIQKEIQEKGWGPLHLACISGDAAAVTKVLTYLLKQQENQGTGSSEAIRTLPQSVIDSRDNSTKPGYTPLHHACKRGHAGIVSELLQHGADVSKETGAKQGALQLAVHGGHADVVGILLQQTPLARHRLISGSQPQKSVLSVAAEKGYLSIVEALLAAGMKADDADKRAVNPPGQSAPTKVDGKTALHYAAEKGHVELVKLLLEAGARVAATDSRDGWTPLHWAVKKQHLGVVELLLAAGADASLADLKGQSPLAIASNRANSTTILKELQQTDKTILVRAAAAGLLSAVATELAKHPAWDYINRSDEASRTPLHCAASAGHAEVVKALLQANVDVHAVDKDGCTALHLAAYAGHVEVVQSLIALRDGSSSTRDRLDHTPLHTAAAAGHAPVVNTLLLHAAVDVHAKSADGCTALLLAARHGHLPVVEALANFEEVDLRATDNEGRTALDLASMIEESEGVEPIAEAIKLVLQTAQENRDCLRAHPAQVAGSTEQRLREQVEIIMFKQGVPDVRPEASSLQQQAKNSAFAGVFKEKEGKWRARGPGRPALSLGTFCCEDYAAKAADIMRLKLGTGKAPNFKQELYQSIRPMLESMDTMEVKSVLVDFAKDCRAPTVACPPKPPQPFQPQPPPPQPQPPQPQPQPSPWKRPAPDNLTPDDSPESTVPAKRPTRQETGLTNSLHNAAQQGVTARVESILKDPTTNVLSMISKRTGETAMHVAARHGRTAVIQQLAEHNARLVNQGNKGQRTPLHIAAENGQPEAVRALLWAEASVNETDMSGDTALHKACKSQRAAAVVEELFAQSQTRKGQPACVPIVALRNNAGKTVLHVASAANEPEVVDILLRHCDLDTVKIQDQEEATALHTAAAEGHLDVVDSLLNDDQAGRIAIRDARGRTPLHEAARYGHLDVVERLLEENDIDVTVEDKRGNTAEDVAGEGHWNITKADKRAIKRALQKKRGEYHIFISHAGEQKQDAADVLRAEFRRSSPQLRVFFDKESLPVGEKSKEHMIWACNTVLVGVVIMSPEYVRKEWPMRELGIFLDRAEAEEMRLVIALYGGLDIEDLGGMRQLYDSQAWCVSQPKPEGDTLDGYAGLLKLAKRRSIIKKNEWDGLTALSELLVKEAKMQLDDLGRLPPPM